METREAREVRQLIFRVGSRRVGPEKSVEVFLAATQGYLTSERLSRQWWPCSVSLADQAHHFSVDVVGFGVARAAHGVGFFWRIESFFAAVRNRVLDRLAGYLV
ncbi:MAG: hypothetical protein NTW96_17520 [Planctomycetia bacterium]|nr:hypothetical protein [Planctomycetia bacterium]